MRSRAKKSVARTALVAAMVGLPVLGGAAAVKYGPPKQIEVAGAPMTVSSEIGKNYSSLSLTSDSSNSLLVQDHETKLGESIGASASINQRDITYSFLEQVAADPAPLAGRIQEAAQAHFVERAAEGSGGMLFLELAGFALVLYGGREDRERRQKLLRLTVASIAAAGAVTSAAGFNALTDTDHQTIVGNSLLADTPLADVEIQVKPDVISYLIGQALDSDDSSFYQTVAERTISLIQESPYLTDDEWTNFVLVDDLQGNNGMAQEVGTAANTLEATIITSGDMTNLATKSETYIFDTMEHYADLDDDNDTSILMAAGLHDTQFIIDYAKQLGFIVPDGSSEEIEGVSVMGFNDPRVSNISTLRGGNALRDPDESVDQFIERMITAVCAEQPDLVFTHDHKLISALAKTGCARIVIAGRTFGATDEEDNVVPSADTQTSVDLILGSGGGHHTTNMMAEGLEGPAEYAILQINSTTGEARYVTVTVEPSGDVAIASPRYLIEPEVVAEAQSQATPQRDRRAHTSRAVSK
jgi:hypothetical protein